MQKKWLFFGFILLFASMALASIRYTALENFESGSIVLSSWGEEDMQPDAWTLDSSTPDGSSYCLKLTGNCYKLQQINPYPIDTTNVLQVQVKTSSNSCVQGIGFTDGVHNIFYSFSGTRILDIEVWIPVYQGAFNNNVWNTIQLPIGSDWQAFWGYLPIINGIIYVNDLDGISSRNVYFDNILDISSDLPIAPVVSISTSYATKDTGVNFYSNVFDPDSDTFTYEWSFGDSTYSSLTNPYHFYTVSSDYPYTVTLEVTDDTGKKGFASTQVTLETGASALPVTLNFVGDIMLARGYESGGGIIPTLGVNAIFAPSKPYFGDAADISVANLEVVLANIGVHHPTKSVYYRGNPANVNGLIYAGIDLVSTANNHTMDYGISAYQQMQGVLNNAGIIYSGCGVNSYEAYLPAFYNCRGLNIAFLASSDRTGQYNNAQPFLPSGYCKPGFAYMTPYYVEQQIQAVENVADLKIVEMHGGSEYSLTPGSGYDKELNPFIDDTEDEDYCYRNDVPHQWDIDIRHSAVDSGADLVIVHHPHIIQGLEVYHNKLIAHSLGNFAFDLDYPETMPTMILYADAYFDGFRNFRIKPFYIDQYIPKPATGQLAVHILDYIAGRSRELNTRVLVDKDNLEARVLMDADNPPVMANVFNCRQQLLYHIDNYNYTPPIKLPRQGSLSELINVEPRAEYQFRFGQEHIWYGKFEDEGCTLWVPPNYSTTDYIDGTRSAKLSTTGSSSVTSTIPKRCKIYDNTTKYTLHGWIKTENVASANIMVSFYTSRTAATASYTDYVTTDLSGNNGWDFYYKELNLPSTVYYYDVRLQMTGSTGFTGIALFDDVGLIEWTEYANPDSLHNISWPNNYYWLQARTADCPKSMSFSLLERSFRIHPNVQTSYYNKPQAELKISPNPFNPDTSIQIALPLAEKTTVKIYNIKGQLVKELFNDKLEAGSYRFNWDANDANQRKVASGIYFIKLDTGYSNIIKKAVLLK
ncbi:MAG: CapA family protein [Candidatus Cloacimonas sp.]